jgi:hypothetical protein
MRLRESIVLSLADDQAAKLVARTDLIAEFYSMAASDFTASTEAIGRIGFPDDARTLRLLLEAHTRATAALRAMLLLLEPDEVTASLVPEPAQD